MKKIKYTEILDYLKNQSVSVETSLNKDDYFLNINSVSNAKSNDLSFFSNIKYLNNLKQTNSKACLIKKEFEKYLPDNCSSIVVDDPYYVFALLTKLFSNIDNKSNGVISKYSTINNNAKIHKNVQLDPYTFIGSDTEIMDNVIVGSNTKIGNNVCINKNCIIHDNVTISDCIIMENCEIQSGARIGGSGFGFEEKSKQKIYHSGNVLIGKFTTIGSNTTVDRAVFDSTSIGEYSQIDNLVQIAHNVKIGKHAIIAAQVGIAGSTEIGNYVKIGGQAGIAGHLNIGDYVTIAGKSGVTKNIESKKIVAGFPAKDINLWKRDMINIERKK